MRSKKGGNGIIVPTIAGMLFATSLTFPTTDSTAYYRPETKSYIVDTSSWGKEDVDEVVCGCEDGQVTEEKYILTEEEYNLLLRVCMSETGGFYGEEMAGKIAVVETILNRYDMGLGTIEEIVAAAYSTADNGEPDTSCRLAVDIALTGNMYPDNMIYFRTEHYHEEYGTPYMQIGNHYFSLEEEEI